MDDRRQDPPPAAPHRHRDRQSPDLDADPQSAAAPSRREYAEATEFGRIVVNGTFTFALLVGLSVGDTTLGTLVANLGYDKVRMPKPVFIGDTLRAETEVIALKDSNSRPEAGIVTFEHRMLNQRDELVCTMERTALMQRGGMRPRLARPERVRGYARATARRP